YYVAGFLSYEAGLAFEKKIRKETASSIPLLWFGVYRHPIIYNHRKRRFEEGKKRVAGIAPSLARETRTLKAIEVHPKPSVEFAEYQRAVEKIEQYILEGDTYQVNYTFKLRFLWSGSPAYLFRRLQLSQRVSYSAFVSLRNYKVLSLSPELFFRMERGNIILKPMKGTAPRGRTLEEDREQMAKLRSSEKDRAENLMIVDMLRNDVGRVAQTASVKVARYFDIEKYDTLFQATSTIHASLRRNLGVPELVRSLFHSGSVTGAPKIRTMEIIQELEPETRGIYTGAVGFFAPKKKAVFNVAIRTVVLDQKRHEGAMGVGGGIVADSETESEYNECLLKGKFLSDSPSEFELLETIRWDPGKGYFLMTEHLKRLERSAEYFGFPLDKRVMLAFLRNYEKVLRKAGKRKHSFRIRLTLGRNGLINAAHFRLDKAKDGQYVSIAERRTSSSDRFLFHKTTHRKLYDDELERAMLKGYFDVLFLNEHGQLTEGARSNVILKMGDRHFTPPISCGLLAGTYRAYLLRSKKYRVEEKVLTPDDLRAAQEVYVCNAVRGRVKVKVDGL
ncbi:MAG: aminodeoxychorismate synthase component I, partial [Bacteroidota bacterium]